jgi:hypothetical protein
VDRRRSTCYFNIVARKSTPRAVREDGAPYEVTPAPAAGRASPLVDTRVVYCGNNLEQLQRLTEACVDFIYIDPPFNSNRNYEVFWGETKETRAFEAVLMREDRDKGFFVSFDYSADALTGIGAFFKRTHKVIVALTVREILDERIALKLA